LIAPSRLDLVSPVLPSPAADRSGQPATKGRRPRRSRHSVSSWERISGGHDIRLGARTYLPRPAIGSAAVLTYAVSGKGTGPGEAFGLNLVGSAGWRFPGSTSLHRAGSGAQPDPRAHRRQVLVPANKPLQIRCWSTSRNPDGQGPYKSLTQADNLLRFRRRP
jgi:hypothetical protein